VLHAHAQLNGDDATAPAVESCNRCAEARCDAGATCNR
jgi:hypothetical protein